MIRWFVVAVLFAAALVLDHFMADAPNWARFFCASVFGTLAGFYFRNSFKRGP